jgi:hypothetical protein
MKALRASETSVAIYQSTRRNIAQDFSLQQHLKPRITKTDVFWDVNRVDW